jgi:hypothetical protein
MIEFQNNPSFLSITLSITRSSIRADFLWLWKSYGTDVPCRDRVTVPCPCILIGWEVLARYMIGREDFLDAVPWFFTLIRNLLYRQKLRLLLKPNITRNQAWQMTSYRGQERSSCCVHGFTFERKPTSETSHSFVPPSKTILRYLQPWGILLVSHIYGSLLSKFYK